MNSLQKAKDALTTYKSETQQFAMPAAPIIGIVISTLGIRCLGNLVDHSAIESLGKDHPLQLVSFNFADVLLTGALVGGGSDAKCRWVYRFMAA